MTMKWYSFKYIILFTIQLSSVTAFAQSNYEKRIEKRLSFWEKLIPTHHQLQYAGGMGLLSGGAGWEYGNKNRWETDMSIGFLPRYSTEESKWTFTLKQIYTLWNVELGKNFSLEPLSCGLYANTVLNGKFWITEPDKYPSPYYSFSTKLRFHIFLGQRIRYRFPYDKRFLWESISLFYELSSNDLYIVSAAGNSRLKPADYLRLSFGAKFYFGSTIE
ncbi:MAG: hypothetical protein LBF89_00435 [Bacteroidales bacterium]|nr:hypothetical protein [Bacteroidales bacterium]